MAPIIPGENDGAEQFPVDVAKAVMTVARDTAAENAGRMYTAAHDSRVDTTIGQQESGGDRTISQSHGPVDHLCQEARQGHDQEILCRQLSGKTAEEFRDTRERNKRQDGGSDDHKEEGEQAPFDHLLPAVAAAGKSANQAALGHQYLGQFV